MFFPHLRARVGFCHELRLDLSSMLAGMVANSVNLISVKIPKGCPSPGSGRNMGQQPVRAGAQLAGNCHTIQIMAKRHSDGRRLPMKAL